MMPKMPCWGVAPRAIQRMRTGVPPAVSEAETCGSVMAMSISPAVTAAESS